MDLQNKVGKNRYSKQVLQKKAEKPSISKGAAAVAENMVMLEIDPVGRGSSRNTFLAKRKC